MAEPPLITCLLVTMATPQRFDYFQRSVADYCRQTHAKRELLVITDNAYQQDRATLAAFIASLGRNDIRLVYVQDAGSLGSLRNRSMASARGDVLCQWDDDDMHHPSRLEQQYRALAHSGCDAVILQQAMQYYPHSRTMHLLNWRATEPKGMPGSIMFWRTASLIYPEIGPLSHHGEDTAVLTQLHARNAVHVLADLAYLYVYVSHGANTWPDDHHNMLTQRLAISRGLLSRGETQLRQGLSAFDFGPGSVLVQGANGPAFTL